MFNYDFLILKSMVIYLLKMILIAYGLPDGKMI
jgi:hypothetical protein